MLYLPCYWTELDISHWHWHRDKDRDSDCSENQAVEEQESRERVGLLRVRLDERVNTRNKKDNTSAPNAMSLTRPQSSDRIHVEPTQEAAAASTCSTLARCTSQSASATRVVWSCGYANWLKKDTEMRLWNYLRVLEKSSKSKPYERKLNDILKALADREHII